MCLFSPLLLLHVQISAHIARPKHWTACKSVFYGFKRRSELWANFPPTGLTLIWEASDGGRLEIISGTVYVRWRRVRQGEFGTPGACLIFLFDLRCRSWLQRETITAVVQEWLVAIVSKKVQWEGSSGMKFEWKSPNLWHFIWNKSVTWILYGKGMGVNAFKSWIHKTWSR